MVYNVLQDGVMECSNTLEDEQLGLPPQAVLYQPLREHIYSILLPSMFLLELLACRLDSYRETV